MLGLARRGYRLGSGYEVLTSAKKDEERETKGRRRKAATDGEQELSDVKERQSV